MTINKIYNDKQLSDLHAAMETRIAELVEQLPIKQCRKALKNLGNMECEEHSDFESMLFVALAVRIDDYEYKYKK